MKAFLKELSLSLSIAKSSLTSPSLAKMFSGTIGKFGIVVNLQLSGNHKTNVAMWSVSNI